MFIIIILAIFTVVIATTLKKQLTNQNRPASSFPLTLSNKTDNDKEANYSSLQRILAKHKDLTSQIKVKERQVASDEQGAIGLRVHGL